MLTIFIGKPIVGVLNYLLSMSFSSLISFGGSKFTLAIYSQNDLQKVTAIANQMVTVFGMSDKVGQISYQSGGGGWLVSV